MTKERRGTNAAIAYAAYAAAAALVATAIAACDTPPASPVSAGTPAIASAHPSPDPPPNRPIIVDDAGLGGSRDAGGLGAVTGAGDADGGADDPDGGAGGANGASGRADGGPDGGALSAAWQAVVSGSDAKIAALRPAFRACYTHNIKGRPQGRVVLHASVAADGTVGNVTAGDTQGVSGRVVACMIDVMKGAQLPAPGRATTLDVPISFP